MFAKTVSWEPAALRTFFNGRPLYNSLGEHPTLLAKLFLINDSEDCNYVHKVFFSVPTGEYGHVEVGLIWNLIFKD
jgi:hypothetical protein